MRNKRLIILIALLSGISYAGINAATDYYYGEDFKAFDFIFNFILWVIIGGLTAKYSINKSKKNKRNIHTQTAVAQLTRRKESE